MNEEICREFEERLVEYADGELLADEHEQVRRHVERCARCRMTVEALLESIRIAEAIWQGHLEDRQVVAGHRRSGVRWWRLDIVAAAACLVLGIGGAVLWSVFRPQSQAPLTVADVEDRMARSAAAARLLAAADLLGTQAGDRALVESQYRYILRRYPDTDAAAEVRLKLQSAQ